MESTPVLRRRGTEERWRREEPISAGAAGNRYLRIQGHNRNYSFSLGTLGYTQLDRHAQILKSISFILVITLQTTIIWEFMETCQEA